MPYYEPSNAASGTPATNDVVVNASGFIVPVAGPTPFSLPFREDIIDLGGGAYQYVRTVQHAVLGEVQVQVNAVT